MQTVKELTIDIIKKLPDESTIDDIMEALWVRKKILIGQQQIKDGRWVTHEEARKRLEKVMQLKF